MSPSPNSDMPIKINDLDEVEGDDHQPHRDNQITVPNPETFHPKNHPDLGLDYIFEVLCAVRRLARQLDKNFIGYLIEMAILEVDKERKAER